MAITALSAGLSSSAGSWPAAHPPHLQAGDDQEGAKQVENPVKLCQQPAPHQNHEGYKINEQGNENNTNKSDPQPQRRNSLHNMTG